jgi:hypothetical protein
MGVCRRGPSSPKVRAPDGWPSTSAFGSWPNVAQTRGRETSAVRTPWEDQLPVVGIRLSNPDM